MKRLILVCIMILCLVPLGGWAEFDYTTMDYEVSEKELTAAAAADFPDWTMTEKSAWTALHHQPWLGY